MKYYRVKANFDQVPRSHTGSLALASLLTGIDSPVTAPDVNRPDVVTGKPKMLKPL